MTRIIFSIVLIGAVLCAATSSSVAQYETTEDYQAALEALPEASVRQRAAGAPAQRKAGAAQVPRDADALRPPILGVPRTYTINFEKPFYRTRVTIGQVDLAKTKWPARLIPKLHPNEKGTLVGLSMLFKAEMVSLAYTLNYQDPSKSDIALGCGAWWTSPGVLATQKEGKGTYEFGEPGRIESEGGRLLGAIEQSKELLTIFFFVVPPECAGKRLRLHLRFYDKYTLKVDIGPAF
jgi:hypothetical protein